MRIEIKAISDKGEEIAYMNLYDVKESVMDDIFMFASDTHLKRRKLTPNPVLSNKKPVKRCTRID